MDFEKTMKELEEIVNKLENGNLTLNEMIETYEKGIKLSASCDKILQEAELKINILSKNEGEIKKTPFESENL